MPTRLVREGILDSDRINQLDWPEEVFYRRLMSKVDDYGLFDARPAILRTTLYPLKVDRVREADISRWIAACVKAGVLALYSHGGKPYGQMLDTKWQARSEPKHPLPPWGKGERPHASANNCLQPNAGESSGEQPQAPVTVFGGVDVDEGGDEKKPPRKRAAPPPPAPEGVSEQVWADWTALRKAKRAPITDTVLTEAMREAEKAGMTLERFLTVWCARGSQGLQADWLRPNERGQAANEPAWRAEQRERTAQAAPGVAADAKPADQFFIDVEARNVAAIPMG